MSPKTRSHEHRLRIAATRERVWKAITEPAELVRWFPLAASADPREGGHLTYTWGDDLVGVCRIEAWDPPRHLRTTWMEVAPSADAPEEERARLAVDWYLEADGGATVLRLVHSGFGADARWDDEFDGTRRGWTFELGSLAHYLERHPGRERRAMWLRESTALDTAEAWRRFGGRAGFLRGEQLEGARPGERYELTLATGESIAGTVRIQALPQEFAGTVDGFGDGLFRTGVERFGETGWAHVWLSTWELDPREADALEARWREGFARTVVGRLQSTPRVRTP